MATNYEFQGSLYNSPRHLAHAIAFAWLSADGANPVSTVKEFLAEATDKQLAHEVIEAWGFNEPVEKYWLDEDKDESATTWMSDRDLSIDDIAAAFGALRNPSYFQECFGHMEAEEA